MTTKYPMSQLIRERRTVKKFKKDSISIELLSELLEIASWAPNHKLREPWRFIIYHNEGAEVLANLIFDVASKGPKMKKSPEELKNYFASIPAHILVVMPEDPQPFVREEDYAATCALIQNFQLAAWERVVGVFWKTDSYLTLPEFREGVGVEPGEKIAAILHIGYPDIVPKPRKRTEIDKKITVIES
ncbi:nitroreductase [Clostridium sp. AL.422]|uniref:nitroreductase family protein n=1 Tax=Clostridium TaxID=1485 RepID=UPI00293DACFF|nr:MULTISPECIES: nitroreductase [unclassified Clostridium]MDV4152076.1 nitroreductase [Clostridium sp. AL.422]